MNDSEIKVGGIVRLQGGGPILTLVSQTPYFNTFGYFDNNGIYHTFEVPNKKVSDDAFKDIYV